MRRETRNGRDLQTTIIHQRRLITTPHLQILPIRQIALTHQIKQHVKDSGMTFLLGYLDMVSGVVKRTA